jgi:hypothetical protein
VLQYGLTVAARLARRAPPARAAGSLPGFRDRVSALLAARGAGHKASAQVTAAVLMYRAVTFLPSIPLDALACLTWRYAPVLISASPCRRPSRLASR